MRTTWIVALAGAVFPVCALAVDGQILINQATVTAAGGFPYRITQSGSYKLTGNLTVTSPGGGIIITAYDVTLDLNGFSIVGPAVCSGTPVTCTGAQGGYHGILSMGELSYVTAKNGHIRGFDNGIWLKGPSILTDLQVTSNFGNGIALSSALGSVVVRCTSTGNQLAGFMASHATITESTAQGNYDGFNVSNSTLSHNIASLNGHDGIIANGGSLFQNTITFNGAAGLMFETYGASRRALYGGNTITDNGTDIVSASQGASQNNNQCGSGPC